MSSPSVPVIVAVRPKQVYTACAAGTEMLNAPIRTAAVPAVTVARVLVGFMAFPLPGRC
jgi:hypothetical protein